MKSILYRLNFNFRQDFFKYAIFGFILLSCIFCGIYSEDITCPVLPALSSFILRIIVRLVIFIDAFFLSLYPIALPVCLLTLMSECCLWGIYIRSSFSHTNLFLYLIILLLALIYLACVVIYMNILLKNISRFFLLIGFKLSLSARLTYTYSEVRKSLSIFLISIIELTVSSVICSLPSA